MYAKYFYATMKLLILASVLCFAQANLLQRADTAVDESIIRFFQGTTKAGSLSEVLGVNEKWLDQAGDDIQTELGKRLKEALEELVDKVKDHVDKAKEIARDFLDKVKNTRDEIEETGSEVGDKAREILQKIRGKAREIIKNVLEKLGVGNRNLDELLDSLARGKLRAFLDKIIEKLTHDEAIQRLREYIKNLPSESEFAQKVKNFVQKLRDSDIKEIIRKLLDWRPKIGSQSAVARGETWDKIKEFFKDLKIKIGDHYKKFGEWVKESWGKGIDKLKEKYGTIKAIAMELIAHGKDVSAETWREALEFFRPYKDDLGSLWDQLKQVGKEAIGNY